MDIRPLHRWDIIPKEAIALQEKLRGRVVRCRQFKKIRTVAGADIAVDSDRGLGYAAAIVYSYPGLEEIERQQVSAGLSYPYVPGLLSFREGPVLLAAFERIRTKTDVILFDGQGIAHPRGLGLASHMGLWLDIPTIGCAKSRLTGEHDEPGPNVGDWMPLYEGRRTSALPPLAGSLGRNLPRPSAVIGAVLRTRKGVKPIFVSIGHRIDLESSIEIVLSCLDGTRIPKPTREADRAVAEMKRKIGVATIYSSL